MKAIKGLFFRDFKNAYFPEILKELYRDRIYAPYFEGKQDLTILDIGANVGLFSFYAYSFAKKIYAVEPSQEHQEVIEHMTHFNKMSDKVSLIKGAVGLKDGKAYFYHSENTTMFSLKEEVNNTGIKEEVEVMTLDTLIKKTNESFIDFIKLDVEGSEGDVLMNGSLARIGHKIGRVVGEYHTWSGVHPHQIEAVFIDNKFQFEWIRKTEATIFTAWH